MNPQLLEFERFLSRRSTECCKILCVPYSTYADKRSQSVALPPSIAGHIETLKRLAPAVLNALVRERLYVGDPARYQGQD
jgi:hypothetical protein